MKIGILGPGHIARGMAYTIRQLPETEGWAVASRNGNRARAFADEFGFVRAYGSYEELYRDSDVELVYVSTPHNCHYEQVKQLLLHGKHILCEKVFTLNLAEAEELIQLAEERRLFVSEAQTLRFLPLSGTARRILRDGVIGRVLQFSARISYPLTHKERVMRPELGGGGLLDIGVYPLTVASMLFGDKPEAALSDAVMTETGVDAASSIYLRYPGGVSAVVNISIEGSRYLDGVINGTDGYLILRDVNHMARLEQYDAQGQWVRNWEETPGISNFAPELSAAVHAIHDGRTECAEYPHQTLLSQMALLDRLRRQWSHDL